VLAFEELKEEGEKILQAAITESRAKGGAKIN